MKNTESLAVTTATADLAAQAQKVAHIKVAQAAAGKRADLAGVERSEDETIAALDFYLLHAQQVLAAATHRLETAKVIARLSQRPGARKLRK